MGEQPSQRLLGEGQTACGWAEIRARHMDEYGAAASTHQRPTVVVDLDDEVVEPIVAPQAVAGLAVGEPNGPVVAAVRRVLAPAILMGDAAHRKQRAGPRPAVRTPPHPDRPKAAPRGCAVALALVGADPRTTQGDWQAPWSAAEPSPCSGEAGAV